MVVRAYTLERMLNTPFTMLAGLMAIGKMDDPEPTTFTKEKN